MRIPSVLLGASSYTSLTGFEIRQGLAQHDQCRLDLCWRHFAPAKYMIVRAIYELTYPDPLAGFQG